MINTIILNGPPGVGKDTLANSIVKQCNATKQEFKAALYRKTAEHFNYDLAEFIKEATDREQKENPLSKFSTTQTKTKRIFTPRQALIHVSENIYKPKQGKDYFGVLAAKDLVEGLNVFSDGGGWIEELEPVTNVSNITFIFKLYRKGFTFDGDSRNYYSQIPSHLKDKIIVKTIKLEDNNPQKAVDFIKETTGH
jgi:adenylate kinase family enzyme